MRDLLVVLDSVAGGRQAETYGLSLAAQFGANATATAPALMTLPAGYLMEAGERIVEDMERQAKSAADKLMATYIDEARARGVIAETVPVEAGLDTAARNLAGLARHFDLTVVGQPDPDQGGVPTMIIESLLFQSGRPALLVPYTHQGEAKIDNVIVAWNGGREATLAIAGAMPILKKAKNVQVISIVEAKKGSAVDLPGFNITRHLARHGVNAELKRLTTTLDAGNTLLSHAADHGADLLVMGAYGHSRLRELILGGATREILESMTLPVLMAH